jgi:hypothetical protein
MRSHSLYFVIATAALAQLACKEANVSKVFGEAGAPSPDGRAGVDFGVKFSDAAAAVDAGSCAFQSFAAERLPLDLVVLVDASASMGETVPMSTRTKWEMVQEALGAFLRDPGSAGMAIGLQFFPLIGSGSQCTNAADCNFTEPNAPEVCEQRRVCLGPGMSPATAPGCGRFDPIIVCPSGTTCVPVGLCAMTSAVCANIGGACPGGIAGNTCQMQPTTCYSANPVCEPERYGRLAAPLADLPAAAPPLMRILGLRRPGGSTPMAPAAIGVLRDLRARLSAMPRRRAAMIVATDGLPGGCGSEDIPTIADALWVANTTSPAVPTYVIGVLDGMALALGRSGLTQLAQAGGTTTPFILTPGEALPARLLETLGQIRGDALPCEYVIPEEKKGSIDFGRVNVHFRGSTEEDIPYVTRAAECHPTRGGWYYDVDPVATGGTPTRVIACEATCRKFKSEPTGKVELRFGCKTLVIP